MRWLLVWFVCLVLIGAAGWFTVARYHECRRHGFSVLYCVG